MTKQIAAGLFFIILSLCLALPGHAQNKDISESDKAVFAFFKLTNGTPAYEEWVKNSEKYITSADDPKLQEEIYEIETLRLKWGFGTYDVQSDFIKIRTPIKLVLHGKKGKETLSFLFPRAGQGNVPYFPFPYGKEWIAMIVSDLEGFLNLPLTETDLQHVTKTITPDAIYDGEIVLHLRAVKADSTHPLPLDGTEQWLMMGETGYFELIVAPPGGDDVVLASYMAPWYLSNTEKELFPLLAK